MKRKQLPLRAADLVKSYTECKLQLKDVGLIFGPVELVSGQRDQTVVALGG